MYIHGNIRAFTLISGWIQAMQVQNKHIFTIYILTILQQTVILTKYNIVKHIKRRKGSYFPSLALFFE